MSLDGLALLVRVAELGTFAAVADELGVPKSTVSRRLTRLEQALGVALLHRSGRAVQLSDDGRALVERSRPALRELTSALRDASDRPSEPQGVLRLTAAHDLGTSALLTGLLAEYGRRHPRVRVDLQLSNRVFDLFEEGLDLAFRTHTLPLDDRDDVIARRLGSLTLAVYGSPAYLAEQGRPQSLDDLDAHRLVGHRAVPGLGEPSLLVDDFGAASAALAAGAGLGLLPDFVAAPWVASGALERVLPEIAPAPASLSLVWLRSRHLAPRVRAFIDLAVAWTRNGLA